MELPLKKDLCFFDIEATGLNVLRDRIIQVALVKYPRNGQEPVELELMVNPGIPISAEAMGVHGITPKDVAGKPVFAQVADQLFAFIGDADLAGYNIGRFDIPLLMEEFARVGLDFKVEKRRVIDVQRIFYKMEPRNLRAALRYYCQQELVDAHDAMADVRATIRVFEGQLKMYEDRDFQGDDGTVVPNPIRPDVQALHDFTQDTGVLDVTNRLKYNEQGEVVFNFGKYAGVPVFKVFELEPQYGHWILSKEFSVQVKTIIRSLMKEFEQARRSNG